MVGGRKNVENKKVKVKKKYPVPEIRNKSLEQSNSRSVQSDGGEGPLRAARRGGEGYANGAARGGPALPQRQNAQGQLLDGARRRQDRGRTDGTEGPARGRGCLGTSAFRQRPRKRNGRYARGAQHTT